MNTITQKLRAGALGLALVSTALAAVPVYAQDTSSSSVTVTGKQDITATPTKPKSASKQENIGVVTGLAVGAAAGGPVGAIVGAAAGAWIGDHYHKKEEANKALKAKLDDSETQRASLARNVDELNGSLAQTQKNADELQTAVSFRTNDSSVSPESVEMLQKMGSLAASMPDMKVVVAGFADPRGSEKYNDALSRRRAEAVAGVLADAGVAKDHLIIEGHGKGEANAMEGDVDGYAFDRKVTVKLERAENLEVARND